MRVAWVVLLSLLLVNPTQAWWLIREQVVASAPPETYEYFDETFESTGGDEVWTEVSGVADFDNTVDPLDGLQSLTLDGVAGSHELTSPVSSPVSDGYFSFRFKNAGSGTDTSYFFKLKDASSNDIVAIRMWNSGTQMYLYYWHNGSRVTATSHDINTALGNQVYLGIYYKAGASDAEYKFWMSTTPLGSSWGVPDYAYTGKISPDPIATIYLERATNSATVEFKYDNITGADTEVTR